MEMNKGNKVVCKGMDTAEFSSYILSLLVFSLFSDGEILYSTLARYVTFILTPMLIVVSCHIRCFSSEGAEVGRSADLVHCEDDNHKDENAVLPSRV